VGEEGAQPARNAIRVKATPSLRRNFVHWFASSHSSLVLRVTFTRSSHDSCHAEASGFGRDSSPSLRSGSGMTRHAERIRPKSYILAVDCFAKGLNYIGSCRGRRGQINRFHGAIALALTPWLPPQKQPKPSPLQNFAKRSSACRPALHRRALSRWRGTTSRATCCGVCG